MGDDGEFSFINHENDLHRNFAESSNGLLPLQGKTHLLRLDAHCAEINLSNNQPIVILGPVGCGKSALLANWVRLRHNATNDDSNIFYHAIGCSRLSSSVSHLLRRLENWLMNQFHLNDDIDLSSDDQLPWLLPRLLERASKKGNAIIVLDGLNHLQQSSLRWLPSKLPPNIHMILSSTSASDQIDLDAHLKKEQVKIQQICDEIARRDWPVLLMDALSEESVRSIAAKHLSLHNDIEQRDEFVDS